MRTKSLRIASAVSSSTIRVPVRPPASPVATTGTSRHLSARAMLIPFPPARVRPSLARWRCPGRKFGTVSVRSIAAFRVTVTSTSGDPAPDVFHGLPYIPPHPGREAGSRDRARGHERAPAEQAAVLVDGNLAEPLASLDGQARRPGHKRTLHERVGDADVAEHRTLREEPHRTAPEAGRGRGVRCPPRDHRHVTVLAPSPREEPLEIDVALVAGRAAEDGRVERDAAVAVSGDLV